MPELRILTKKSYINKFQKIIKKIADKLTDYLNDPNEENIHDIRIAIRRLEAAYEILPKVIRKKPNLQNYVEQATLLFKINTEIRDFDIITRKLDQHFSNLISGLISSIMTKRKSKIRDALIIASKLRSSSLPKITEKHVSEPKLRKRFRKIVNKLNLRIKQNIPIVLNDEKKIDELHRLRKDFKKLRYTLELTLENKRMPSYIENLKKVQDTLGEIHDSDIMLEYLKNHRKINNINDIIKQEIIERNVKYKLFVKTFSEQKFGLEKLIC
jgi:CHAD domain-containing protein